METKHTPGPLHYVRPVVENESNPPFVIEPADAMRRRMVNRETVPTVALVAREADARLFVAAADLADWVSRLCDIVEEYARSAIDSQDLAIVDEARATLAKARGET